MLIETVFYVLRSSCSYRLLSNNVSNRVNLKNGLDIPVDCSNAISI